MANKYHISKETGRPNICRAKEGNCPLKNSDGKPAPHFDSKEKARAYYEKENQAQTIKPSLKKTSVKTPEAPKKLVDKPAIPKKPITNQDEYRTPGGNAYYDKLWEIQRASRERINQMVDELKDDDPNAEELAVDLVNTHQVDFTKTIELSNKYPKVASYRKMYLLDHQFNNAVTFMGEEEEMDDDEEYAVGHYAHYQLDKDFMKKHNISYSDAIIGMRFFCNKTFHPDIYPLNFEFDPKTGRMSEYDE